MKMVSKASQHDASTAAASMKIKQRSGENGEKTKKYQASKK